MGGIIRALPPGGAINVKDRNEKGSGKNRVRWVILFWKVWEIILFVCRIPVFLFLPTFSL